MPEAPEAARPDDRRAHFTWGGEKAGSQQGLCQVRGFGFGLKFRLRVEGLGNCHGVYLAILPTRNRESMLLCRKFRGFGTDTTKPLDEAGSLRQTVPGSPCMTKALVIERPRA